MQNKPGASKYVTFMEIRCGFKQSVIQLLCGLSMPWAVSATSVARKAVTASFYARLESPVALLPGFPLGLHISIQVQQQADAVTLSIHEQGSPRGPFAFIRRRAVEQSPQKYVGLGGRNVVYRR